MKKRNLSQFPGQISNPRTLEYAAGALATVLQPLALKLPPETFYDFQNIYYYLEMYQIIFESEFSLHHKR
jgi:hypothetical protein